MLYRITKTPQNPDSVATLPTAAHFTFWRMRVSAQPENRYLNRTL